MTKRKFADVVVMPASKTVESAAIRVSTEGRWITPNVVIFGDAAYRAEEWPTHGVITVAKNGVARLRAGFRHVELTEGTYTVHPVAVDGEQLAFAERAIEDMRHDLLLIVAEAEDRTSGGHGDAFVFEDLMYRVRVAAGLDVTAYVESEHKGECWHAMRTGRGDRCELRVAHDPALCGKPAEAHR